MHLYFVLTKIVKMHKSNSSFKISFFDICTFYQFSLPLAYWWVMKTERKRNYGLSFPSVIIFIVSVGQLPHHVPRDLIGALEFLCMGYCEHYVNGSPRPSGEHTYLKVPIWNNLQDMLIEKVPCTTMCEFFCINRKGMCLLYISTLNMHNFLQKKNF